MKGGLFLEAARQIVARTSLNSESADLEVLIVSMSICCECEHLASMLQL